VNPLLADTAAQALEKAEGFGESFWPWVNALFVEHGWAVSLLFVLSIGTVVPGVVSLLVWLERRTAGWIQDRLGPNRVGPFGLFQSFADLGKFLFKEDVLPGHVNKPIYLLAPAIAVIPPLVVLSFIPFGRNLFIADLDTGFIAAIAFSSLHVYAVSLGGWSSNSKYPLLGAVRASAQMISYEIALGLAALSVFVVAGSVRLQDMVLMQADGLMIGGTLYDGVIAQLFDWNIWKQPLGAIIFLIAGFAETNRHPFDMPEAESELASGYHTEYSSMKFALFFLGEYAAIIVISGLFTTLYLGGWTLFGLENVLRDWVAEYGAANGGWINWAAVVEALLHVAIFSSKTFAMIFVFIWVRWTVPRFRYDQLMRLGWKRLLPITLAWLVLTVLGVAVLR
jgi:NADH-quinone oxidoreductase subunit H